MMQEQEVCQNAAVLIPIGPGRESALDTIASVTSYCAEPHALVLVDDHTSDGTYDALKAQQEGHWAILRNSRPMGVARLVHTLCLGYKYVLQHTSAEIVLRLDQDALIIKPGVLSDAAEFAAANHGVGVFGVYREDFNRPRSFESHKVLMNRELSTLRRAFGVGPWWRSILCLAEEKGYSRGDNVFGGAYFLTRSCLEAMDVMGAFDVPYRWHSRVMEDVYFSMAAVAAGWKMGHFAAPEGPLCLEWRGLPYPAEDMGKSPYKVIHSVDKGPNTGPETNCGKTAREVFRALRGDGVRQAASKRPLCL